MMDDIDAVIARIVGPTTQQKKWVPKEAQLELLEACVRGTIRNLRANNVPFATRWSLMPPGSGSACW